LLSGSAGGLSSYAARSKALEQMKDFPSGVQLPPGFEASLLKAPSFPEEVGRGIIFALVGWVFITALYFAMSKLLKGKGTYKRMLGLVGYAQTPMILAGLLAAAGSLKSPMMGSFITIPFGLWVLALNVLAVREANGFTTGRAAAAVLIPIVLLAIIAVALVIGGLIIGLKSGVLGGIK
jgi:hypothetical protein